MNIQKIKLSKMDLIKRITIPEKIIPELAYLSGVLAGDGNILIRPNKFDYRIKCVGNPTDEQEYYDKILFNLFKKVFGLRIDTKYQDSGTTYGFYIYSKSLVKFFTNYLDAPSGKKYNKLKIPRLIREHNLINHYIRGVADTDFCLSFKKNSYPCISGSSNSKHFIKEIALELTKMGFKICEIYDYKIMDSRFKRGYSIINRIELNGRKNLELWMKKIGFWSPKHLEKLKQNSTKVYTFQPFHVQHLNSIL